MTTRSIEEERLDLLAIFHYLLGGLLGLMAFLPLVHVVFAFFLLSSFPEGDLGEAHLAGLVFLIFGLGLSLAGWALAAGLLVAARKLQRRQSRTFCTVVACVSCLFMPFGTVLGVFTLVLLTQDRVRALFERQA